MKYIFIYYNFTLSIINYYVIIYIVLMKEFLKNNISWKGVVYGVDRNIFLEGL